MGNLNNPAERLLRLLQAVKKRPKNSKIGATWMELLGVPDNDKSLLLRRLGQVLELPATIRARFELLEEYDQKIYLKWLPAVETVFSILNLDATVENLTKHYDGETLYGLVVCSDILSRMRPEKVLDERQLKKLHDDIQSLMEEVLASDIDEALKRYMFEHLQTVDLAIQEYRISGSRPLQKAVEATLGSLAMHPEIYEKTRKTKEGGKFWNIMARVPVLLKLADRFTQIAEKVIKLLPGP
jgi:hypothetical protein